jgi:hypothetical protein
VKIRRVLLAIALAAGATGAASVPAISASAAPVTDVTAAIPAHCHARDHNKLPDRLCTPGITYSVVRPGTISKTICKSGWTSTVRPPESYTNALKVVQIRQYGYRDKNAKHYEEDHLIPLELGGSPRAKGNLWPEFDGGHIPNPKDAVENALRRAVCAGKVGLRAAQQAIAVNWTTAEAKLGL